MRCCYPSIASLLLLVGSTSAFVPSVGRQTVRALERRTFPELSTPTRRSTGSAGSAGSAGSSHQLWESSVPQTETSLSPPTESAAQVQVDFDALLKYHAAIAIQLAIIFGIFKGLDMIIALTGTNADSIPTLALVPIFYVLSLKSRVFNPLNNERPNLKQAAVAMQNNNNKEESRGFRDRIMPSWTPPGPVFPVMWLLIIGPIRAYSSALVWQANGHVFCDVALLAFVLHLAVGDVWNTMNNAEQRYGAAVTGVLCVTASALNAAYQYYLVDDMAGKLLGLPMIWFAVAASLVTATWQLNPSSSSSSSNDSENDTEQQQQYQVLDPLYPIVREGRPTTFAWFETIAK